MNIIELIKDPNLFAPWFQSESWAAWLTFLKALFGLPMELEELETFSKHTGRSTPPSAPVREGWVIAGRRAGKSLIASLIAVYLSCFVDWTKYLAKGEKATVMLIACDRRQARILMRYIRGFLENIPLLQAMIVHQTRETIELSNSVQIEVHTASFRSTRGYSCAAVICDEVAFWHSDESGANPDTEILTALKPGLASMPGSLLLAVSSPYSRKGALWTAYQKHYGQNRDGAIVWQADTKSMNSTIPEEVIRDAYEDDPSSAAAEYGAEFRRDIETYVAREAVEACVIPGRYELAYSPSFGYWSFNDPSGGIGDPWAVGIAHTEGERVVLDLVRQWRPPFSPEAVVAECAADLKRYHLSSVRGDRYGGEFPRELFRKHGITYELSDKPKSDIYRELLPLINSGRIELLDNRPLVAQLCSLERRTARGGKDSIDHPPKQHDDVINSAAGALLLASGFGGGPRGGPSRLMGL